MTDTLLTHDAVAERGLVERYVAGRLHDETELEAFEAHLLVCETCREEVRIGMVVRAETRASAPRRSYRGWLLGVGLAAAAGLTSLVLLRDSGDRVRPLGTVLQPPLYLGVPVRSTPRPGDSVFDAAMQAYASGSYVAHCNVQRPTVGKVACRQGRVERC